MENLHDLPEGVGPHEGQELELLLSGEKPLAMFTDIVPPSFDWSEDKFDIHAERGELVKREEIYNNPNVPFPTRIVYYALPDEAWRIDKLHAINAAVFCELRSSTEQDDEDTGRLLGYSEKQIQTFLEWARKNKKGAGQEGG